MRALAEELVNRIAQNRGFIRHTCRTVQIDHKAQGRITRHVFCPTDDEFLRSWIEIFVAKGRGIN